MGAKHRRRLFKINEAGQQITAINEESSAAVYTFDGNLGEKRNKTSMSESNLNGFAPKDSFIGYSGVNEFKTYPLRQIFIARHNTIASEWDSGYLDHDQVLKYFSDHQDNLVSAHYGLNGTDIRNTLFYFAGEDNMYVLLYHRNRETTTDKELYGVALAFSKRTKRVETTIDHFNSMVFDLPKPDLSGHINLIQIRSGSYYINSNPIPKPEIDFDLHYNEDFKRVNELITDRLSVENSKGLVLLHGYTGTGKTTFVRHLVHQLKKKVIFLPPNMANFISDPSMIPFFIDNKNSVLVLEEAENILLKRSKSSTQAVANILNLTDGLLSDIVNIQIIATFNTDLSEIDPALLRKGRLITKYEFKPLEEDRANKLSKSIGVSDYEGESTLANIFNAADDLFLEKREKVGFVKN